MDSSADALREAIEIGILASDTGQNKLAERDMLPYFTFIPDSAFDDIRLRIELGDDLDDSTREIAFRAVEKLATGRGPSDVEFDVLTRVFDGPTSGRFADTIERAVKSKALSVDDDWTPRPSPREKRQRSLLDIFKTPPFPTPQFPAA